MKKEAYCIFKYLPLRRENPTNPPTVPLMSIMASAGRYLTFNYLCNIFDYLIMALACTYLTFNLLSKEPFLTYRHYLNVKKETNLTYRHPNVELKLVKGGGTEVDLDKLHVGLLHRCCRSQIRFKIFKLLVN